MANAACDTAVGARVAGRDVSTHRPLHQQCDVVAARAEATRILARGRAKAVDGKAVHGVVEGAKGMGARTPLRSRVSMTAGAAFGFRHDLAGQGAG